MASLNGQTIASSYEQLLHTDTDGGGNGNTLVSIKDGDNGTTFGLKLATNKVEIIPGSDDANAFEVSQADGTAVFTVDSSTPSSTFTGDVNFDSNTLFVDASANAVGIGTNSPQNDVSGLHISVAASTDQLYLERTGSGTGRYYLGTSNNSFFIVDDAQTSTRLTIDSSGNVGIGTTSPSAPLHVNSTTENIVTFENNADNNTPPSLRFVKDSGTGNASDGDQCGQIMFFNNNDNNEVEERARINVTVDDVSNGSENSSMRFHTSADGASAERMRIASDGKVGIGITAPDDYHSSNQLVIGNTSGEGQMTIVSNGSNSGSLVFADATSGTGEQDGILRYDHNANEMQFFTTGHKKMTVSGSGLTVTQGYPILAGRAATDGGRILAGHYNIGGGDVLAVLSTQYSSGGFIVGYGVEGKENASGYVSTNDAFSGVRSAMQLDTDGFKFLTSSATQASPGTDITMTQRVKIDENGFVILNQNDSGSAGSTLKQLSLGDSSSTVVDFTNIGTMTGAVISNSHNDQNTGAAIVFTHRSSSSGISFICSRNEGSDASSLHFGTRGSGGVEEEFRIDKDGNLTATDTSIGSLSDARMKEEIADYTGGLDIIKNLKPRTFKWKENTKAHNAGKTETRRGFVAQEILEADDYYVREQEVQENETGYEYIKDTGKMYTAKLNDKDAMYISAIQSLLKRIEALENA